MTCSRCLEQKTCKVSVSWEEEIVDCDSYREAVDHPDHYGGGDNPYEAIKVIEAWELGFCLGNAVKYISRAHKKGTPLQDLKKAAWYLEREILNLEEKKKDEFSG